MFLIKYLKKKKSVSYKPILHEELMGMIGWEILWSKYLGVLDSWEGRSQINYLQQW